MKVYILYFNNSNGDAEFIGVYSSPEKAQEKIDKFCKWDQPHLHYEETDVDD